MALNVVAAVDVGMGMCVSVGGLMGALIGNCTFLVELPSRPGDKRQLMCQGVTV